MSLRDVDVKIDVDIDDSELTRLNNAVNAVISEFGNLDTSIQSSTTHLNQINDQQMNALINEIAQIRQELNALGGRVDDLEDDLANLNNQDLGGLERSFGGVQAAVVAVGAAVGVAAGAIVVEMMEVDEAFARLQVQTGATGEELKALEDAAKETFTRGYGESLQEVTDAMARVRQNIHGLDDEELSNVTANALLLANAFDSEVNEVTRGTQGLMDAFGISADKAFDLFAHGAQNGLNVSDDMFDQMAEFSGVALDAGYTVEELFGIMQRGAANGVYNLDRVNNSILEFGLSTSVITDENKEMFGNLSKSTQDLWSDMLEGKATSKELSTAVVQELKAMDDQNLANNIGIALFGSMWEDNKSKAMYAMFETTDAMKGFDGAMAASADVMEGTFKNRMLGAWRELKLGIVDVANTPAAQEFFDLIATKAEELVPYLISAADSIVEFAGDIVDSKDAAVEFIDTYTPLIAGLAGGAAVYYTLTAAVGAYNAMLLFAAGTGPIYTAVTAGMTAVTGAFGAAIAFATSPIFLIAAAIGAAIAIGVLLYKNWDTVILKAGQLKDWLGEKFTQIKTDVTGALSPILGLFDNLLGKWNNFKSAVSNFSLSGAVDWVASKVPGLEVGLGRVPYDDMPALLHKDEAVLPKDEANTLRQAGILKGDGTHPSLDLAASQTYNQVSSVTSTASTNTTSVQAPVQIIVQGGSTNEETGQSLRDALEEYFADLNIIMEG